MKIKKRFLFLICMFTLNLPFSCYKVVKVEPEPTPEPTPTPPNAYETSIRVEQKGECNLGDKIIFELKPDGNFTYISNVNISKNRILEKPVSVKLSENEISGLKSLLNSLDIDELAKKNTILASSPQTEECRAIEKFSLIVNNKEKVFDRNARLVVHSPEYNTGMEKLRNLLENLKKPQQVQIFAYDFPIIVTAIDECKPGSRNKTLYNVAENGDFTYLVTDHSNERTVRIKITPEQISSLRNLIDELNISSLAENETIPYQETSENQKCRVIENYMLMHNSKEDFFDRNGRKFEHSKEFIAALDKLRARLEELKKKN